MKREREFCVFWWFVLIGLATFWTFVAVLAFGEEDLLETRIYDKYNDDDYNRPSRMGEIVIDKDQGRMIIYDETRSHFKEYRLRDQGDGRIVVEEW